MTSARMLTGCDVLVRQGNRLDRDYLAATAQRVGLADLLERAYRETHE